MSHVNTLVTALMAKLNEAPAVCSQINRVLLRPIAKEAAQAVVVRPLQSDVTQVSLSPALPACWITSVVVECYARSGDATAPDAAVDALVNAVYARLMADTTLGGAVRYMRPEKIEFDYDADGQQTTCATLFLSAQHGALGATL